MKTIFSDKINSEIIEKINSFISTGDYNKELEITITQEDVPIKEFLKKNTSLKKNTNNMRDSTISVTLHPLHTSPCNVTLL